MAKFETKETLLYKFLIAELEDDLFYAEQRVSIMKNDSDFGRELIFEQKEVERIKDKIKTLEGYLQESMNTHVNHPVVVELSYINKFNKKKKHIHLESNQLDDEKFYLEESGILFQDWEKLDENKIYIVDNLSLKRDGDVLYSKYPQESMWYHLSDNMFRMLHDRMIYIAEDIL